MHHSFYIYLYQGLMGVTLPLLASAYAVDLLIVVISNFCLRRFLVALLYVFLF